MELNHCKACGESCEKFSTLCDSCNTIGQTYIKLQKERKECEEGARILSRRGDQLLDQIGLVLELVTLKKKDLTKILPELR